MHGEAGGKGGDGRIGGAFESGTAKWNERAGSPGMGNVRTKRIATVNMIAAPCSMLAE